MDKYRINNNENIPNKFWGLFKSDNDSDYLLFFESNPILNLKFKIDFEIETTEIDKLLKWDCLPINRGQGILMNRKAREILLKEAPNCLEFIKPLSFNIKGIEYELDYAAIHILTDSEHDLVYRIRLGNLGITPKLINVFKQNKIKGLSFAVIDRM